MDDLQKDSQEEAAEQATVSRRRLLQLLGASGAVVGLSKLLPANWATPTVEASPNPVPDPYIDEMVLMLRRSYHTGNGPVFNGMVRFRYSDPQGDILSNAPFFAYGSAPQGGIANGLPIGNYGGQYIPYNGTYGTMRFPLPESMFENSTQKLQVQIAAARGPNRGSNVIVNSFLVGDYGQLNISNLTVKTAVSSNISQQLNGAYGSQKVAVFKYNGSLANMVSQNTSIYAYLNSAGWLSPGGTIANMGGIINRVSNYGGEVRFPIGPVQNGSGPLALSVFLEDEGYPYDTNELATSFTGASGPTILSLSNQLCSPSAQDGEIGCLYNVTLEYYDAGGSISESSRVSIAFDDDLLIDDQSFSQLGVSVTNNVQGFVTIPVLIPTTGETNGIAHDLNVTLVNDDGLASEEASTLVTGFCDPYFPVGLTTETAALINNEAGLWMINFSFNDSAGVLSNSARVFATVNSSGLLTPIYNGLSLSSAGGLAPNASYPYYPNGAQNCTVSPVNATLGSGYFTYNYVAPPAAEGAQEEINPTLNWFLTQPSYRESSHQQVEMDFDVLPPPPDYDYHIYMPVASGDE